MLETQVRFRDEKYCLVATDGQKVYEPQSAALPLPQPLQRFYEWLQGCNLEIPIYEAPIPGLAYELMPHQKRALGFTLSRTRSILAMDMGLGKTITVIAALLVQKPRCSVIMAPAGLVSNWKSELKKFAPELEFHVIRTGAETDGFSQKPLTLLPLSLLDKLHKFIPKECDFLAVDEAHYVKNVKSKLSRAMFKLCKKLSLETRIVLLTGTPAQQHSHFYGLLRLLHPFFHSWFHYNPHMVGKYSNVNFHFAERFCGAKRLFGFGGGGGMGSFTFDFDTRRDELQALVRPFFFRLLKSEVLDLPEPVQERIFVGTLSKEQEAFFDKELDRFSTILETKGKKAACKIIGDLALQTVQLKIPFVIQHLRDFLQREPTCKFLCFVDHIAMGDAVCGLFEELKILHVRVDGRVPRDKRFTLLETIRSTHQVGVVSFGTCALGFNLNFLHTCFFCERIWKGVEQVQSEARIHRIGQLHKNIRMYRLDLEGSIDSLMEKKIKKRLRTEEFLLRDKEHKKLKS